MATKENAPAAPPPVKASGDVKLKALVNIAAEAVGGEPGSARIERGETFTAPAALAAALKKSKHAEDA